LNIEEKQCRSVVSDDETLVGNVLSMLNIPSCLRVPTMFRGTYNSISYPAPHHTMFRDIEIHSTVMFLVTSTSLPPHMFWIPAPPTMLRETRIISLPHPEPSTHVPRNLLHQSSSSSTSYHAPRNK
jgi:hypothetical protein